MEQFADSLASWKAAVVFAWLAIVFVTERWCDPARPGDADRR